MQLHYKISKPYFKELSIFKGLRPTYGTVFSNVHCKSGQKNLVKKFKEIFVDNSFS